MTDLKPSKCAHTHVPRTSAQRCRRAAAKVLSSVIVPLLIGVATVLISIVQLQIASKQRLQDLQIANERREQDLHVADSLQKDLILAAYIEQISELALTTSFTLNDTLIANICRAKTLIALRQLDAKRRNHLVKFLYAADMIRSRQAHIRLADAELNDIDLSVNEHAEVKHVRQLQQAAFRQALLNNASFANRFIVDGDFEEASLIGANFTNCRLSSTSFVGAVLHYADFTNASSKDYVNFQFADLFGAIIPEHMLLSAISIDGAILPNGTVGRKRNLLVNSDAEWPTCELDPSISAPWRVERLSGDVSLNVYGYRFFENVTLPISDGESRGRCFFAAHGREGEARMDQMISPKAMAHVPIREANVYLVLTVRCRLMTDPDPRRILAKIRIEQFHQNGSSLQNFTKDIYNAGSYTRVTPCDKQLDRLLFSMSFARVSSLSSANQSDDPFFYVCDNLHLSMVLK